MEKFFISDKKVLNDEELKKGCVSYSRIIDRYIDGLVLCNNVINMDYSIYDNMINLEEEETDIYQYYLCNLSEFERQKLEEYGIILSYSDLLECDVLCVEHYGTSWDYVITNVMWTTKLD